MPATVFRTATEAVEHISLRFSATQKNTFTPVDLEQLKQPLAAINVGLESFYESLTSQGAQAVHVDWRPPAERNERLASVVGKDEEVKQVTMDIDQANTTAVNRMMEAGPILKAVDTARDVIPGMKDNLFLHAVHRSSGSGCPVLAWRSSER